MAADENAKIDATNAVWDDMQKKWAYTVPLRSGTEAMRKKGEKFLPQEPGENDDAYAVRRDSTFLLPAYDDAIANIAAMPFEREVQFANDTPPDVLEWARDVDMEGTDISGFANDALDYAIDDGMVHALVEHPASAPGTNLAEEERLKLRPYFVLVPAASVIGFRYEVVGGVRILTQLRILESVTVSNGPYGEETVDRVRMYERVGDVVQFELHERRDGDADFSVAEGPFVLQNMTEIPLRTLYLNKQSFMHAYPVLDSLAWKNLEHWQSASDQRHILHVARVPILFGAGFGEDDLKDEDGQPLTIGSDRLWCATSPQAKLAYVEHSGAAIASGQTDLDVLVRTMASMSMAPLMERPGDVTATEKAIDTAQAQSDLRMWVRNLETWLSSLFELALVWRKREAEINVDVFDEWKIGFGTIDDLRLIAEKMPFRTFIEEALRRNVLKASTDVDAVIAEREEEVASFNEAISANSNVGDDDDDDDE